MSSNTPSALANKHALLTGAAGGIGLAVATAYLQAGARCSVADIGEQPTPALAALVASHPDTLHYIRTDVTQMTQIDSLIAQAQTRFGPITTLFNNAALFDMAPLLESDEVMFDKMFAVNVKGAFFVMQKVLVQMVAHQVQGGAVVNMASQAGRRGEALVSHYCATKAAVISYTQSAALAMAPHQIRVNGIAPGVIDTPMWKNVDALFAKYENLSLGEKKKQVGAAVPLGYMGDPSDICGAAVFLASAASSYITAQTLNVDGGSVMS
jgi:D-sorbitol dehydrogenase (acceptor)